METRLLSGKRLLSLLREAEAADDKEAYLRAIREYVEDHVDQDEHGASDVVVLRERYETLSAGNLFEPGQLVKWKAGLKNRRKPRYNQPAVVVTVLKEPIFPEKDSGSPYFREPLDMHLGLIDDDGDFILFYFDSRRFQPYT